MATVTDIVHNADAYRRAYPGFGRNSACHMNGILIGDMITFQASDDDDILYGEVTEITRRGCIVRTSAGSHEVTPGMILRVSDGA